MGIFKSCAASMLLSAALINAADFSGKWKFFIELDPVGYGEPVFFLEQKGNALTGRYHGPLGERPVTGTANGESAEFAFTYDRGGKPVKAIYTGKLESAKKMHGKLRFEGFFGTGTWTATRD